jgi:hypothetical protein
MDARLPIVVVGPDVARAYGSQLLLALELRPNATRIF